MSGKRTVCFSHGKESGPWGTKIEALADVAKSCDWQVESLDYQGMDDPDQRVAKLNAWCEFQTEPYVLVGSSMGGHVAASAANQQGRKALGLFLMAPAFYMEGFEQLTPNAPGCPITIVHGWNDDVVPWRNSACFAEPANAKLVLLDDDHRLVNTLDAVCAEFGAFLSRF
ncbi:MAG: alpha/beta hydrolase [Gammaproteobacteria bacterium]|nr:alpha/beta hydrolase [Gammaproteobacteria bacterium]